MKNTKNDNEFNYLEDKPFKVKMVSTTNARFEYLVEGVVALGRFYNHMFLFGSLHTSYITKVRTEQNNLVIDTRNSQYIFEILEDIKINDYDINTEFHKEIEEQCKTFDI